MWYKLKKIYVWDKLVRPKWKPWANTLAYYDFENDSWTTLKNWASSWTTYDGTFLSTPSYWTTTAWKKYFICNKNNYATTPAVPFNYGNVTINLWMDNLGDSADWFVFWTWWRSYSAPNVVIIDIWASGTMALWNSSTEYNFWRPLWWHLMTFTGDGSNSKYYIDWTLIQTKSYSTSTTNSYQIWIWTIYEQKSQSTRWFWGYFWAVMIEGKVWTVQEIQDYYDLTKSNYWL